MKLWLAILLLLPAMVFAQDAPDRVVRFAAIDVYVESHDAPLAAYQLEFGSKIGNVKIVGIEGGADRAFKEPPYYDTKAMQKERVIIAAFSTDAPTGLPKGKTRVATIHVQITGTQNPDYYVKLAAAADDSGKKISAQATFETKQQP